MRANLYTELRRALVIFDSAFTLVLDAFLEPADSKSKTEEIPRINQNSFLSVVLKITIRLFRRKRNIKSFPEEFRRRLERLGPTYIKLGQFLSTRNDLLPSRITNELAKLQDQISPISFSYIRKVIESELNMPFEKVFKFSDEKPIAVGSIAQVHLAELKNGRQVAVKVQRPSVDQLVEYDLKIIRRFINILEQFSGTKKYRLSKFMNQFSQAARAELDFKLEGENADRFRANFSGRRDVVFPKVHWKYSSSKVLTMDYIDGIKFENSQELSDMGFNVERLATVAINSVIKMLFLDGYFHADPHPGNVFISGRSRVAFLDLGMVGTLSASMRYNAFLYFYFLLDKNINEALRYLIKMMEYDSTFQADAFKRDCSKMFYRWLYSRKKDYTATQLTIDIIQLGSKREVYMKEDFFLAVRSVLTIEGVVRQLYPGINISKAIKPTLEKAFQERFKIENVWKELSTQFPKYLIEARNLPETIGNFIELISAERIPVDIGRDPNQTKIPRYRGAGATLPIISGSFFICGTIAFYQSQASGVILKKLSSLHWLLEPHSIFFSLALITLMIFYPITNRK